MPISRTHYNALVDDDGSNTVGTNWNKARVNDLLNDIDAFVEGEGTFTLTLTSAGGGTPTYTSRTGSYLKIGKAVAINGIFTLATKGTLAAGALSLTGLPFTSQNVAGTHAAVMVPYFQGLAANKVLVGGFISPNTSTITLTTLAAAGTGTAPLVDTDISNTFEIIFAATYHAAA